MRLQSARTPPRLAHNAHTCTGGSRGGGGSYTGGSCAKHAPPPQELRAGWRRAEQGQGNVCRSAPHHQQGRKVMLQHVQQGLLPLIQVLIVMHVFPLQHIRRPSVCHVMLLMLPWCSILINSSNSHKHKITSTHRYAHIHNSPFHLCRAWWQQSDSLSLQMKTPSVCPRPRPFITPSLALCAACPPGRQPACMAK